MGIWELQHRRPPKGGIYQQICARGIQRSPANILICFCAPLSGLPLMCAVLTELMLFVMEHETNKKSPETGHSFTLFSELRFFRQFFDNPSLFYLSLVNCMLLRISSTRIRELLERGDVEQAAEFLGHPHILTGTVIRGHQLGRRLGIPTANLALPKELAEPRHGVYACRMRLEGASYAAVTNIGTRPTVNGEGVTVEPWILDYEGNLYGKVIRLEFLRFLRPERRFPDLESLKAEILRNAAQTREIVKN